MIRYYKPVAYPRPWRLTVCKARAQAQRTANRRAMQAMFEAERAQWVETFGARGRAN